MRAVGQIHGIFKQSFDFYERGPAYPCFIDFPRGCCKITIREG